MAECCSCRDDCCINKKIEIEFLYLDLNSCTRCQNTEGSLDEVIGEVSALLKTAGYDVLVNKIHIDSKKKAIKYKFLSSPTIRVNCFDIAEELKENTCKDCGDLCGSDVTCRVWTYEGKQYNDPPKAFIVNAILKEVYAEKEKPCCESKEYKLPQNLEVFFDGIPE